MADIQLTAGIICERLYNSTDDTKLLESFPLPMTLQVLSLKAVPQPNQPAKHRLIVSDGEYYAQMMLQVTLNRMVENGSIVKNSIIAVDDIATHTVRNLLLIKAMRVISKEHARIGSPKQLFPRATASEATPSPTQEPTTDPIHPVFNSFTAPDSPPSNAPSPSKRSSEPDRIVFPIEGLSSFRSIFTIKVIVTQKSEIKTLRKPNWQAKLFQVTLKDDTGDIRATAWREDADKFFEKLQRGGEYYISNATVQLAKKEFNTTTHKYELTFNNNTVIEECSDSSPARYRFTPLRDLPQLPKDSTCDVIGIVTDTGSLGETKFSDGRIASKREITLIDQTAVAVRVTLWGKQAQDFNSDPDSVLAFGGIKVKEFRGFRSLSMSGSAMMEINPDVPETHALYEWYDNEGGSTIASQPQSTGVHSDTFDYNKIWHVYDIQEAELGMSDDKQQPFSIQATIVIFKSAQDEKFAYPSCQECRKKVEQRRDGGWWCNGCRRSWEKPMYRYILSMAVADPSGRSWLTAFDDVGQILLGMTADKLMELMDNDNDKYARVMNSLVGKSYNFMCKAKKDTFNDQVRARYCIEKVLPRDYKQDGYYLKALLTSL